MRRPWPPVISPPPFPPLIREVPTPNTTPDPDPPVIKIRSLPHVESEDRDHER
jgi:hypothetical protein